MSSMAQGSPAPSRDWAALYSSSASRQSSRPPCAEPQPGFCRPAPERQPAKVTARENNVEAAGTSGTPALASRRRDCGSRRIGRGYSGARGGGVGVDVAVTAPSLSR